MCDTCEDHGPGILARLSASIQLSAATAEKTNSTLERIARRLDRPPMTPVLYEPAATGIFPSSGILVLRLGGPDQGHQWYVRTWNVGGLDPSVVSAGAADFYISAMDLRVYTALNQLGMIGWKDRVPVLPNISNYGSEEMPARFNQECFVVISGGTAGQQYTATLSVTDFEESGGRQTWNL